MSMLTTNEKYEESSKTKSGNNMLNLSSFWPSTDREGDTERERES